MALPVYSDVVWPSGITAAGMRGKKVRRNHRTENQAGEVEVVQVWVRGLREYEVGIVPLTVEQWETIEGLFDITGGGAYGMLLLDPKDGTVTAAQGLLYPVVGDALGGSIGVGYGVPSYRLHKRYTAAGTTRTYDRLITRPKSAALLRGGSPVAMGALPGNASLNSDTGTVTFVADSSQAIQSISVGATTVLNFANGTGVVDDFVIGQRVYITGVTGTAASALNSLSHEISAVGATSLTITTSTVGLAVSAAGAASKYPQASESLTWSGQFYVPVHFRDDFIDWDLVRPGPDEDARLLAGPSVVLREVRES